DRGLRITKGVPVVRGDHGALQTILLGVWQVAASSLTTGSACLRSGGSSTIFTSKNTSFGRRFAVARKNCTNDLLAAHYPTPSRRTWRGGLYVRTLHGESTTRHLLCALRGQSVRFSSHRDGAPAVGTSARRHTYHQPVPAFSCLGRVHPQAD